MIIAAVLQSWTPGCFKVDIYTVTSYPWCFAQSCIPLQISVFCNSRCLSEGNRTIDNSSTSLYSLTPRPVFRDPIRRAQQHSQFQKDGSPTFIWLQLDSLITFPLLFLFANSCGMFDEIGGFVLCITCSSLYKCAA